MTHARNPIPEAFAGPRDITLSIPRLLIAGTHSGVGKTTITAGIIAALQRRGLEVQPFKVGPDYIDPTYHSLAAGRPARTLDTWMIPRERVPALFARATRDADIAVIEGVMGLFDGFAYDDDSGSSAEVAKLLRVPVVLVIDARPMARSAAAVARGYQVFDPHVPLAGIIVNRVGGDAHGRGVARAIERATGLPVLGWLPRLDDLAIPERHLGLVPTAEPGRWAAFLQAAASAVERFLDVDALLALAQSPISNLQSPMMETGDWELEIGQIPQATAPATIAIARDAAFSFFYPDNLELLEEAGARLVFFSPLEDAEVPEAHVIILSGGFPEIYAAQLAANHSMLRSLRAAHARGVRIYAECGGLMYLTEEIVTHTGERYPMVGLLPGRSVMTKRLTLGYRVVEAASDSWLLRAGTRLRGHEFHYSVWEGRPDDLPPAYHVLPPHGEGAPRPEGAHLGTLWASYVHLHFWTHPTLAWRFAHV